MKEFTFCLLTDTHFFKNSLGARGREYDEFMRFEQKCFAETEAINKAVFKFLESGAVETDTVIIAGDLSFNGEKESHLEFIKLLNELNNSGKKIYVVTADHDYKEHPFAFDESGRLEPEGTGRDELFDLYYEFGFKDAIAVDRKHLSYVAQLSDKVRLLALNNDYEDKKLFDDEQLAWIREQTKKAREDGQMMFAVNHYPLLAGQPLFSVVPSAVQKNAGEVTTMLADEGVHLAFTGHMHNQSINEKITPSGNRFYDVCTGSVIAYPSVMRLVTLKDEKTAVIKTINAPDFEWDTGGRTCEKYLSDLFDGMILNMLSDMSKNPAGILRKFGAGDKKAMFPIVKFLGNRFNKMTVGGACRLACVRCDKSIKKMKLKDYIAEMVRGVFAGNQTFNKGTPKGDAIIGVISRLNFVLKKIHLKNNDGEPVDLRDIIITTAGNYGLDDWNETLILED